MVNDHFIGDMMILREVTFHTLDKIKGSIQTTMNDTL